MYSAGGGAACTFSPESLKPSRTLPIAGLCDPATSLPALPWCSHPVQGFDPLAIWPVVSSVQRPYTACRPAGPGGYLTDVLSTRHRAGPHKEQLQARARQTHQAAATASGDAPGKLSPRRQNGRSCDCRRGHHPTGRWSLLFPGHLGQYRPIFRISLLCKQISMARRSSYVCRALEGSLFPQLMQRGALQRTLVGKEKPKSRVSFPHHQHRREMCRSSSELPTLIDPTLQR